MTTGGTIILAGGGDAEDSRAVDALLAEQIGPSGPVLYLPIATDGQARSYESCLAWLTSTLRPHGLADITMWTDLAGKSAVDLAHFATVYLGGGNTFRLLRELHRRGFDRALAAYAASGGVIYGGSAGAIVLGADIMTCAHQDRNEVGLADTRGVDLCLGYAIWCHYTPDDDPRIVEYVDDHRVPVLALSERAGARIGGGELHAIGPDRVMIFERGRTCAL